MRSESDIVLTPYIEMLRLFIRAAHALKVGKNQNLTAREAGCEGSIRVGYDYTGEKNIIPN